ncbi:uncharacterized protein METZ01_LOCUS407912, partial [marine metagenome]
MGDSTILRRELGIDGWFWLGHGTTHSVYRMRLERIMGHRTHAVSDTIVACATAPGEGAVAIVRLSGPKALELGRSLAPSSR